MIGLGPDGLNLGPAVMNWGNLSLILGLFTWLGLAKFPHAQAIALVTLLAARLGAALPGWTTQRSVAENLWDILDLRRGDWAWGPGLAAGVLFTLLLAWHDLRRVEAANAAQNIFPTPRSEILRTSLLPAALRAAVPALVVGSLSLLLKPAPTAYTLPASMEFTRLDGTPATLPRPAIVNLWATWCGPCRSELPLLLAEAQSDPDLILLNVGEAPSTVQTFLKSSPAQVWLGGEKITISLRVTGFPTTLVINSAGEVVARHLGPLTRAQFLALQRLKDTSQKNNP